MEIEFTPGPWQVGPVDDTVVTHVGADGILYEVAAIDGDYNSPDQWPTMEANARLIAAAPEMLAALLLGVKYDDMLLRFKGPKVIFDGDVAEIDAAYDAWVAATRAAVAKAVQS